jgi:hypothetical protein
MGAPFIFKADCRWTDRQRRQQDDFFEKIGQEFSKTPALPGGQGFFPQDLPDAGGYFTSSGTIASTVSPVT